MSDYSDCQYPVWRVTHTTPHPIVQAEITVIDHIAWIIDVTPEGRDREIFFARVRLRRRDTRENKNYQMVEKIDLHGKPNKLKLKTYKAVQRLKADLLRYHVVSVL